MSDTILGLRGLKTHLYTSCGIVKAVDGVTFDIRKEETFGLVGESGSGKTLTALSILRLIPRQGTIVGGEALFNGADLLRMDEDAIRAVRGARIAIVFQEPSAALNPVFTVGEQVMEALTAHTMVTRRKARDIALRYLERVHMPEPHRVFFDYPHQLSGGMKQRVGIAMALVNSPEFLILDEPTTSLDVTIQAQILDLLEEIREREKVSILFISHDFGIIARMCGRVAVMRKGKIVEAGETSDVLRNPKDPYTVSLLESVKALA